jgi:hypothetical protein
VVQSTRDSPFPKEAKLPDNAAARPSAVRAPIDQIRRLILLGVLAAMTFAVSETGQQFEKSKQCQGGFSAAFSARFQRHRCDIVIRHLPTGATARIPFG